MEGKGGLVDSGDEREEGEGRGLTRRKGWKRTKGISDRVLDEL